MDAKIPPTNNVLITGASGFVGGVLAERLIGQGMSVNLVSRKKDFTLSGATMHYGDLSDAVFCENIARDIDTVYYLAAAKKNIAHHTARSADFVAENVAPLLVFLRAAAHANVKKIVYLSSTQVIGRDWDTERDGYAIGKHAGELIVRAFARQHGITAIIVRAPGVYGPGDNFDPETANFIPSMILKVFTGNKELSVWGSGKREMQFIYVDDIVANLIAAGGVAETKDVLVGNPETLTVNQIAEMIIALSGKKMAIMNDTTKPDQPSRLFEFTNLIPPAVSLLEGLRRTITYYTAHHV